MVGLRGFGVQLPSIPRFPGMHKIPAMICDSLVCSILVKISSFFAIHQSGLYFLGGSSAWPEGKNLKSYFVHTPTIFVPLLLERGSVCPLSFEGPPTQSLVHMCLLSSLVTFVCECATNIDAASAGMIPGCFAGD